LFDQISPMIGGGIESNKTVDVFTDNPTF